MGYLKISNDATTSTNSAVTFESPTTTGFGQLSLSDAPGAVQKVKNSQIEDAVFGHIQALRALGRTSVNTVEIARALGVSLADVESAVLSLGNKGVKAAS